MRTIHVHGSAESDLIDVWRYSLEQWGELQADKYLDELDTGIRKLGNNPEIGMKRDYVRDGYRVLFVGSHAVYYTVTPDTFISSESYTGAWIRTGIWNSCILLSVLRDEIELLAARSRSGGKYSPPRPALDSFQRPISWLVQ